MIKKSIIREIKNIMKGTNTGKREIKDGYHIFFIKEKKNITP